MEQKTRIKGNVHYVGVNDRNKHLFEGMWPLPYGVSYNSYLIDDEMVALVDTVDICYFEVFLHKIKKVIGDRPINYLIINHMEPDHSGSIRLIKQHYPDIVIVGNKQTFGMIEGFYGVTGEQYLVKDGDFLALGKHKLRFYLTPMVHWPETMMTFDETDGILFSGDGFGCFGTVDGGFLDTRINTDRYWDEMVRYYSNIVGKYGSPVQTLLKKAATLDIQTICPLHGPILKENLPYYIGKYQTWSSYEPEDKGVLVACASIHGNTKAAAEKMVNLLQEAGAAKVAFTDLSRDDMAEAIEDAFRYDSLVLCAASYDGGVFPPMEDFLNRLSHKAFQKRKVGIIENGSWAPCAAKSMKAILDTMKNLEICDKVVTIKTTMKETDVEHMKELAKEIVG